MLRWLGAGLILCGGLLTRHTLLDADRRAQRTRRALAEAFEMMEAEIRLLLTPMPSLLRRDYDEAAAAFFAQTSRELERGVALPGAWGRAAGLLALPPDERGSVAALGARFGWSEESVCAALSLAASTLRKKYAEIEEQRAKKERLTTSICISISLFLVIFLL